MRFSLARLRPPTNTNDYRKASSAFLVIDRVSRNEDTGAISSGLTHRAYRPKTSCGVERPKGEPMSKEKARISLLGMALAVFCLAGFGAVRGSGTSRTTSADQHVHHRPGSIVGVEHPELIPDDRAYSLMLRMLAGAAQLPDGQRRVDGYFSKIEASARVHLSPADRKAILDAASTLHSESRRLEASRATGQQRTAEKALLLSAAMASLTKNVSTEGQTGLSAHVRRVVKPNMKILK